MCQKVDYLVSAKYYAKEIEFQVSVKCNHDSAPNDFLTVYVKNRTNGGDVCDIIARCTECSDIFVLRDVIFVSGANSTAKVYDCHIRKPKATA